MDYFLFILILFANNLHYPFYAGALEFPHDEGAHFADTVTSEWWYMNMDLVDETGDSFGIMLTHFRKPAVARIFNLTDVANNVFHSSVGILGSLFCDTGHVFITYRNLYGTVNDTDKWTYPQDGEPFSYLVKIDDRNINVACSLHLSAFEYPFAIDSLGIVTLGDSGNVSYYYAIPFINVQGKLDIGNEYHRVEGIAWIDRQWGPFGVSPEGGYEWFSAISSQNNRWLGIQVWNLFENDSVPHSSNFRHLNIFAHTPDTSFHIFTSQFILERLGYIFDPVSQKYFSRGWRVVWQSDSGVILLEIHPEVDNQIVTFVTSRFYEGITYISRISATFNQINFMNHADKGYGFAELVQKYDTDIITPSTPEFAGFSYNPTSCTVRACWHPSLAGSYPIAGYRVYFLDPQNPDHIRYFQVTRDTFIDIPSPPDSQIVLMISAFDSASAVNGSDLAGPFIFTAVHENYTHPYSIKISSTRYGANLDIMTDTHWNLSIVSSDGRILKRLDGIGKRRIKLKLKTGVYFTIVNNKHISKIYKFIVVR